MTTIVIDGLNEEEFRRSIENRLREGMAGVAITRLRKQLEPFCGPGGLLPERFLTIEPDDLFIVGWDGLGDAVRRRDLPGRRITGLSIAFGWPGEDAPQPDERGHLRPHIETSYFSDNAWPFSLSAREDLLEGYTYYGCAWSGDAEAVDNALSLEGVDDLHGALALLEAQLLASDEPDEQGILAGSLGACLLSALLVQAVADRAANDPLFRPICVMAGSNGVYPYFDAPVAGMTASAIRSAEEQAEAIEPSNEAIFGASMEVPAPRYSSLLMTSIPRARKRPALVLVENDDDMAERLAKLRQINHPEQDAEAGPPADAAAALAEIPLLMPERADDTPLLAQKPARKSPDFRDMLGPREVVPFDEPVAGDAWEDAPQGPAALSAESLEPRTAVLEDVEADEAVSLESLPHDPEPADPEPRAEPPLPGFALLAPDLQQRLEMLLAGQVFPGREAAPPPLDEAATVPALPADSLPEPVADPIAAPVAEARAEAEQATPPVAQRKRLVVQPSGLPERLGIAARLRRWATAALARIKG